MHKNTYFYFAYGGCYSEVEVDVLTGDFVTLKSHLIHDVGRSLNQAVDIGQVLFFFLSLMKAKYYNDKKKKIIIRLKEHLFKVLVSLH